ncbi:MAG: NAD(P)-dependent oxidoreductase [Candidatus Desulfovibrio faecigallinarum]|uniref:NAD-dependent epimerase/dehydratase family protein n=1 Tax=Desulfovibrio sp. An276 TaxID=1965618 RepID=UPI000B36A91E|nr:NAD(P)-dependent oxidoreductase [Desulfovibrio sp. An276]MBU3832334.1 NAD(P)-dependent oxidoreductase [Candidatus Desulfovibrio faecigallinarum]OUO55333.1 NAD-dependent epimerase [Desulfovibrio sp. An276]
MKITVFGGSGFLGSHICDKLSEAGHEVTIVDLNPSPWLKDNQKMIVGSILDEAVLDKAVEGADIVCNYAGIADIGEANSRPVDTARLNVVGNVMALEACRKYGIKRYIFASSLYVYGKSGGFYRCSKQACEIYIENYQAMHNLPYTILRYGSLYGPRADNRNAIHRFVHEAMTSGTITYYGAPTALREYVHVDDAATATLEVLDESFANQNIIVTGNQPMRVGDLFKMIGEMLGKDIEIRYQNDPNSGHYQITPYSFMPKVGRKLVPPLTVDLGQGILRVMEAEHRDMHPELTSEGGYLVPTDD